MGQIRLDTACGAVLGNETAAGNISVSPMRTPGALPTPRR